VYQLALEGLDGKYVDIGLSGGALIFLLAFVVCLIVYYFLRRRVERKVILGLLALFVIGYAIRLFVLLRGSLIYGIDGPWYISQVGHILQDGAMTESTAPLVMYFTAGLSAFCGDVTLGVKISQAFLSALPILTIWLLAKYITNNNLASFVAALGLGLSAMTVGMSDVLRNTGALAFLPLFYLFFLKFVREEGRKWTITSLKFGGRKLGLTFSSNLVLSLLIFLLILGCHFLTAGFAVMTVVAYMAFYAGYRRKIPWRELKFVAVLGLIMLVGIAASGTLRNKVLNTANTISTSEPVPAGLFPFSQVTIPSPGGEDDGGSPISIFITPLILLSLPAMLFTLWHHDRRYLLFTATVFLALLCSQSWIIYHMYAFRLMIMIYIALFVLIGISIWRIRKRLKKIGAGILACVVGFSAFTIVGMAGTTGAYGITEEDWNELTWIGEQLPENSIIMTPGTRNLFYWGPLLFGREIGDTFMPWGPQDAGQLASYMQGMQQDNKVCLAVVGKDYIEGENLENLGLEIYDNLQTEHYCVLKLAENSKSMQRSVAQAEGPGGLPEYPGSTDLEISKENIEENYFQGYMDFSPPEISAAAYSTSAAYSEVLGWYRTEMSAQGWTIIHEEINTEDEWGTLDYSRGDDLAHVYTSRSPWGPGNVIVLVEGPASAFGWGPNGGPSGGPEDGGPEAPPAATSAIRFNHNPLFAFILLPIELVQGLYGTTAYGVMKLVVAIPLSVGLIGLLIGLALVLARKFKKAGLKPQREKR